MACGRVMRCLARPNARQGQPSGRAFPWLVVEMGWEEGESASAQAAVSASPLKRAEADTCWTMQADVRRPLCCWLLKRKRPAEASLSAERSASWRCDSFQSGGQELFCNKPPRRAILEYRACRQSGENEARLPTICEWAEMAEQGCLIGYGPDREKYTA